MNTQHFSIFGTITIFCLAVGCATAPDPNRPATLAEAKAPVWALKATHDEMVVSVSPAKQTMKLAGTTGAVLGAGISAVSDARHRKAIRKVMNKYDACAVFEQAITERLTATSQAPMQRVAPLGTTAGHSDRREVERTRYVALAKNGADVLLDLKMTFGIFGSAGTLVTKLDGQLRLLPEGKRIWNNTIVVHTQPILACQKLADPTKQFAPDLSSLRFSAKQGAVAQWTRDGGQRLQCAFEEGVKAAVSALLCDLGQVEEAEGEYYLGKLAMNRKHFDIAHNHFTKAATLAPTLHDARNGQAVNLAHKGQVAHAIALAREITESEPAYGPAWFNLAWWHAKEKKDYKAAASCYRKALTLGLPAHPKLETLLQNGKKIK